MYAHPTTWGDVWTYGYVRDKTGEVWKIAEEKDGWMKLVNRAGQERVMLRPDPAAPVTALQSTEEEALGAIFRAFPGAQIIEIQQTGA